MRTQNEITLQEAVEKAYRQMTEEGYIGCIGDRFMVDAVLLELMKMVPKGGVTYNRINEVRNELKQRNLIE